MLRGSSPSPRPSPRRRGVSCLWTPQRRRLCERPRPSRADGRLTAAPGRRYRPDELAFVAKRGGPAGRPFRARVWKPVTVKGWLRGVTFQVLRPTAARFMMQLATHNSVTHERARHSKRERVAPRPAFDAGTRRSRRAVHQPRHPTSCVPAPPHVHRLASEPVAASNVSDRRPSNTSRTTGERCSPYPAPRAPTTSHATADANDHIEGGGTSAPDAQPDDRQAAPGASVTSVPESRPSSVRQEPEPACPS